MAEDKEKPKNKAADPQADQPVTETSKPKPRRSTTARKTAASKEEKPKRTRATDKAKPKADDEAKPKTPARRHAASKAKAPQPEAPADQTAEKAAEEPAEARKAPARRRRAAPKSEAPKAPPVRPVVTARAKYVRSSARKARLVLEHVRGKPIGEARALLQHSPRGVARDIERLLASAIANAENNHDLVGEDLYVKEIYADEGPTLKRFRARAQGRAYRVRKRTSHLTVALTPKE
jgi:ribosomal protein L22